MLSKTVQILLLLYGIYVSVLPIKAYFALQFISYVCYNKIIKISAPFCIFQTVDVFSYRHAVHYLILYVSLSVSYNILLMELLCVRLVGELLPSCVEEFCNVISIVTISIAMNDMAKHDIYSSMVSIACIIMSCMRIVSMGKESDISAKSRFEL